MKENRKSIREKIADYIIDYRKKNKLTQEEFGNLVDTDKQYISKAENCQMNFHVDFLDRLEQATKNPIQKILKS